MPHVKIVARNKVCAHNGRHERECTQGPPYARIRVQRYPCGYAGFDRPDERQEGCFEREFPEYFIYLGNIGWEYEVPWRDRR